MDRPRTSSSSMRAMRRRWSAGTTDVLRTMKDGRCNDVRRINKKGRVHDAAFFNSTERTSLRFHSLERSAHHDAFVLPAAGHSLREQYRGARQPMVAVDASREA